MITIEIPRISHKKLEALARKIRPVARFAMGQGKFFRDERGDLYYVIVDNPRKESLWNASRGRRVMRALVPTHTEELRFVIKKGCGYSPTVADVLAQINPQIIHKVVAFELTKGDGIICERQLRRQIDGTLASGGTGKLVARTQPVTFYADGRHVKPIATEPPPADRSRETMRRRPRRLWP